jgi:internalin A
MVLMPTAAVARPWRRYLRISVRGLIVVVLVLGGGLGWVVNRARVQREAVAAIERAGGSIKYKWDYTVGTLISSEEPAWPKWLLKNVGPNYLAHIAEADLARGATDELVRPVAGLKSLETLILRKAKITGPGLAPVAGLADLHNLNRLS